MKKTIESGVSRRGLLKFGLGAVGTVIGGRAVAEACGVATGQQILGPFFPRNGTPTTEVREDQDPSTPIYLANDSDLTVVKGHQGRASGQVVYVRGRLTDEGCDPIANATIIVWQASHTGKYNHNGDGDNTEFAHPKTGERIKRELDPKFQYWGRAVTGANGEYTLKTIVPGFYPADLDSGWYRPPHIHFMVTASGFAQLVTQMYFRGDKIENNDFIQELNRKDLALQSREISDSQRDGLVVDFREDASVSDGLVGRFDIKLTR